MFATARGSFLGISRLEPLALHVTRPATGDHYTSFDNCGRPLRVTLVEGQGSGPIMCAAVRKIVEAAGVPVHWDRHTLHVHVDPHTGRPFVNADLVRSATETGLVLRSPDVDPASDGSHGNVGLALHKALGASVGVKLFESAADGNKSFGRDGIVTIRDNVSSEYSEIEHIAVAGKRALSYIKGIGYLYVLKDCV